MDSVYLMYSAGDQFSAFCVLSETKWGVPIMGVSEVLYEVYEVRLLFYSMNYIITKNEVLLWL